MPGQEKIVSVRIAPADQRADLQADDGHHRDERVAQRVQTDDAERRQALGARGAHIVLAEHLQHRRARHARDDGERDGAEHDRRQDEMVQTAERNAPSWPESRLSISMKPVTGSK